MKVIVAGSRSINDQELLYDCLNSFHKETPITHIVCGGARGADTLGKQWAEDNQIPVIMLEAQWDRYGKPAGMIRNREMGDLADYLIAFWDRKSPGTKHMIEYMRSINKHGTVIYTDTLQQFV